MKRKFIYICLFSWLILAGGCWNRIEVENLAIASALCIDKPAQGDSNQVLVSILVEKPGEAGVETLADRRRSQARQQEIAAHDEFSNHPLVRDLVAEGGKIREDSIRPRGSAG